MKVGDKQKYIKRSTAAQWGVQKPHLEYIRGLGEYRCTVVQRYRKYRKCAIEDGGSWVSVKRDPDMYN
jgi:hypothetical protein